MKNLLLLYSIFWPLLQSLAQPALNRAYHDVNEKPNPFLVEIGNDLYFTTYNYGEPWVFGINYLYKQGQNGKREGYKKSSEAISKNKKEDLKSSFLQITNSSSSGSLSYPCKYL